MKYIERAFVALGIMMLPAAGQAYTADIVTDAGRVLRVTALTDNIIRVTNLAKGESEFVGPASVLDPAQSTATVTATQSADGNITFFTTASGVNCSINARSGGVTIMSGANSLVSDNGVRMSAGGRRRSEERRVGKECRL